MLEQLSRHSGIDLAIKVNGDLHIDEHHTIEDTAIALGEAFAMALGNKKELNAMVSPYPWMIVLRRCPSILAEEVGSSGRRNLKEKRSATCLLKCSIISSNRFQMLPGAILILKPQATMNITK